MPSATLSCTSECLASWMFGTVDWLVLNYLAILVGNSIVNQRMRSKDTCVPV